MPDQSNPLGPAITALKDVLSNFFHAEDQTAADKHAEKFIFHVTQHVHNTMPTHICHLHPESVHAIALEYARMTGCPPAPTRCRKPKPHPDQKELPLDER